MHPNAPPRPLLNKLRLIAITDAGTLPYSVIETLTRQALDAGLQALMLRDKTMRDAELLPIARRFRRMTSEYEALLIMNRRLELAAEVNADAVHLGVEGPTIEEAREHLGPRPLIGYSAHRHDEALAAFEQGADYVFISPVFPTPSKQDMLAPIGLQPLRALTAAAGRPVIALGGIDPANCESVFETGVHGIAVIRGIFGEPLQTQARTRMFIEILKRRRLL